jgi:hypothetical protein
MAKKIAIIGTASTSVHLANDLDDSWQIWTCNGAYDQVKRQDKHFELHDIAYLRSIGIIEEYLEWFKKQGSKIVLQKKYDEFPDCDSYPLQGVLDTFKHSYFNNTIAYMIAYAMYNNPDLERLAIFGVDMAGDGEYGHQRPCCEFWLGYALSKGIILDIPDNCPLIKSTHLYGFESPPAYVLSVKNRAEELTKILKAKDDARVKADREYYYFKGANEIIEKQKKVFL